MSQLALSSAPIRRLWVSHFCRYFVVLAVFVVCAAVVVNAFALATFEIPTGSMAPYLRGHHRVCTCPRCGDAFPVGRHAEDRRGAGESRLYRKLTCQQCGQFPVPMNAVAETRGDRVLVNQFTYRMRTPARWEAAVFRLFGSFFAKRILGLPGEEIEICDGDIYINGKLCRKTLEEALAMRVLLFDSQKSSDATAIDARWERNHGGDWSILDGRERTATLTYRNFDIDGQKCEPIRDEYSYNAGVHAGTECVHDFLVTCELDVRRGDGDGEIVLQLCDGGDWTGVRLPVGKRCQDPFFLTNKKGPDTFLRPGRHTVVLALVDRRLTLSVDGAIWLQTDLPESSERVGVERPFRLEARGVRVTVTGFQLHRDVHYGQQGVNGVRGKAVRLDAGQYFVLGDNSPRSEDSRHWPNDGQVAGERLIGPVVRRISK